MRLKFYYVITLYLSLSIYIVKFNDISFKLKHNDLVLFHQELILSKMILCIEDPIQKREKLMCLAPELYNKLLKMNSNKYDKLPPSKLTNAGPEYDPETLFLDDSCNSYGKKS